MSNQSLNIEVTIARDFLEKFTRTKSLSPYSPSLADVAERCGTWYLNERSRKYNINSRHVFAAAESLKIEINSAGQLAISAEQFNQDAGAAYREDLVCSHGHSTYTFIYDALTRVPRVKTLCPKCAGILVIPDEIEVLRAVAWFKSGKRPDIPLCNGAIILAARRLGYHVAPSKNLIITKAKPLAASDLSPNPDEGGS